MMKVCNHGKIHQNYQSNDVIPTLLINLVREASPPQKKSSATAEIDDGPCGASTLSSWRSESSNLALVVLDKLLFGIPPRNLLEN